MTSMLLLTSWIHFICSNALIGDFQLTPNNIGQYLFRSAAAGIYDNKLIVWGGYNDAQQANNDRYEYDLSGITQATIGLLPYNTFSQTCPATRTNCGSYGFFASSVGREQFNNRLYLASIGLVTATMTIYNLSTRAYVSLSSYTETAPWGAAGYLNDHCAAASSYSNKLYLFGHYGSDSTDDPSTTLIYDISADIWSLGSAMATPLWQTGCATNLNGSIIYTFAGGVGGSSVYSDLIQEYNVDANVWTALAATKVITARYGFHCVTNPFVDEIICMGGTNGASLVTAEVFEITTMHIYQINMMSNGLSSIAEAVWVAPTNDFGYIFAVNQDGIQYTKIESDATSMPTTKMPTISPTNIPSAAPSGIPSISPTEMPTESTAMPTTMPSGSPLMATTTAYEFCVNGTDKNINAGFIMHGDADEWSETLCEFCICSLSEQHPLHPICDVLDFGLNKKYDTELKNRFMEECEFECSFEEVDLKKPSEQITECGCNIFQCQPLGNNAVTYTFGVLGHLGFIFAFFLTA